MGTATIAVQLLLSSIGHHAPLEPEISQYVTSVLEDPDPDTSLDLLVGVLSGCVEAFAALDSDSQAQLVLQMFDSAQANVPETAPVQPSDNSIQAAVAALRQVHLEQQDASTCADITNSNRGTNCCVSAKDGGLQEFDLAPLQALCPAGINPHFLQHCVCHNFHNDVQAAANWLLEATPQQISRDQRAWEDGLRQQELQQQESELLQRRQKKLIVDKFDLCVVADRDNSAKRAGRQQMLDLQQAPKKSQQPESKLRYRDGKLVSTKGEKVIVEKVTEDWDGGSRGKVYTKGKRGKGFH